MAHVSLQSSLLESQKQVLFVKLSACCKDFRKCLSVTFFTPSLSLLKIPSVVPVGAVESIVMKTLLA